MSNNKLIVYSATIAVKRDLDIYHETDRGIYSNIDEETKIDDLTLYNQYHSNLTNESVQLLVEHYKDKLPRYKSTFILNNGNYVWEKTELELNQKHLQ